jgi:alkanesulfonate monooxygenase SsuD/methylene tetrahydromethanopterin reductase-like flavin-dependent oxidoreductase (luciferase family)
MNVGVGLPSSLPRVDGSLLLEWARRADEGPFTSLGVVDRMRYRCLEPLTVLSAAAIVTSSARLATTIAIGPLRNSAVLAKQAATIDAVSSGRLTLGLAVGARHDDYEAAGVPAADRGKRLSNQLVELRATWDSRATGPGAPEGPDLLVGGSSDIAIARAARHADGYVHGGGPPRLFERTAETVRTAWDDAGRPGAPKLWAQGYFTLGDEATVERGLEYMLDYYAFTGPFAQRIAQGLLKSPQAVMQFVRGYAEAGCDELLLFPAVSDLDQLDRLREVLTG